ncbi:MAG TPA: PQQ-binding-like beta-propeller repeat protein [Pyrinomonadaceae bacterium]
MNSCRHRERIYLWGCIASVFLFASAVSAQSQTWPQWGGPNRNFKSDARGLANTWPAAGPRRIWIRELGDGYSAIVADGSNLYTMYRRANQEVVIALDASTGKTVWEYSYDAPFLKDMDMGNGVGPHSTPLIAGNHVYAVGATSKLHCLDKRTGKLVWSHDLWKEFNGTFIDTGYSCSPLAYKNTIILTVGGAGHAVMAFNQKDGTVAWSKQDFANSPSSPISIKVADQDQLVVFMAPGVAGLDSNSGDLLWSYPHATKWDLNISTPVWSDDGLLFLSSAYGVGSRVLELIRRDNKTSVKELWYNNRVRVHKDNAIRVGDNIYASTGDFGPAFFTAIDARTGNVVWQERGLSKASFLYADGKFIILDEDGHLALATASQSGLKIHSKLELLKRNAWTVPTLLGTRLYVRDQKTILALDLS